MIFTSFVLYEALLHNEAIASLEHTALYNALHFTVEGRGKSHGKGIFLIILLLGGITGERYCKIKQTSTYAKPFHTISFCNGGCHHHV